MPFKYINLTTKDFYINPFTGCWIWTNYIARNGYAYTKRGYKTPKVVHKLVFESLNDRIKDKKEVNHICGIRSCMNPNHLELLTQIENLRIGLQSKINPKLALEIRDMYKNLNITQKDLGLKFNLTQSQISRIINNKRWANV